MTASLARIWENVLDWEHLPWLHRSSFLAVRLREATCDGWRAALRLPPAAAPRDAEIEVRLDRPRLRYVTRTVGGFGAGSEIAVRLEPIAERVTRVCVEFLVPIPADPAKLDAIGAAYVRTYMRLWDEDEAMMVRRQALLDRPSDAAARGAPRVDGTGRALAPIDEIRAALPLTIEWNGEPFLLIELDGALLPYASTCPHLGGPLADAPVENGCVTCPWHGYRFDVRTGANLDGRPCRLARAPAVKVDAAGVVRLSAAANA